MTATPDELLAAGQAGAALNALQAQVRERAGDAKLRVFLFQLLCVLGQWERAAKQLETCGEMDDANLAMVAVYRDAVRCEALRADVLAGRTSPLVFGRPEPWIASLVEALAAEGRGDDALAAKLRAAGLDAAPSTAGTLNGESFEWIADADPRLGPVLETVVDGHYQWVPFATLSRIEFEAPTDLRDLVWQPAHLVLANGGERFALVPVRYARATQHPHDGLSLARRTEWVQGANGQYRGLGQRTIATDATEMALLDVRQIVLSPAATATRVH